MRNGLFLEIIACTVADAVAAAEGGADRIELISHYEVGGLTPPLELVREVLAAVTIPVRVMLRDAESFFVTAEAAREQLCQTARELNSLPIEGIVLGFLRHEEPHGRVGIDCGLLERVLAAAPNLRFTFHRASESLPAPGDAIDLLKPYPSIDTLLTSGGPNGSTAALPSRLFSLAEESTRRPSRPSARPPRSGPTISDRRSGRDAASTGRFAPTRSRGSRISLPLMDHSPPLRGRREHFAPQSQPPLF